MLVGIFIIKKVKQWRSVLEIHPFVNDVSDFFAESDNNDTRWEQFLSLGGTIYNVMAIYDAYSCLTVLLTCSP